ncbi:hypothetical protein ACHAPV_010134 [Trichoderma viride]
MTFKKIALAGASGNLGARILRNLLESADHVFQVTVLTRSKTNGAESFLLAAGLPLSSPNQPSVVSIQYDDHPALVQSLKGHDVLIAAIAGSIAMQIDPLLLSAAQEAAVRRIIPSQYTLDMLHPAARALFQDDWPDAYPIVIAQRYKMLAEAGGPISYTGILTSMFLDVFLETALFGAYDIRGRKSTLVDDCDAFFTACSTDFIAASVVAVLKLPEDATKNKRIAIAEVRTTGNELVKVIEEVFGIEMNVQYKSSDQMGSERRIALAAGNARAAYALTVAKLAGDGSGPGDLTDGLEFDADGTLTFQRKSLKELVFLIKERMPQV